MSYHIPILTNEIVDRLKIKSDGVYMDCTMGFGGHSESIVKKLNSKGNLIGIDLDPYALKMAKEKLKGKYKNIIFSNSSYIDFPNILNSHGIKEVDGFLFDLGISSYQVDSEHRGFSYRFNGPLNMKFNQNDENESAEHILNSYSEKELSEIIKVYGEERYHKRIAKSIVEKRKRKKITNTFDLKEIVLSAIPFYSNKVLSRVFQSIRITVNDEINIIKNTLPKAVNYLKVGGRIAVISFHSIEDRIIKHFFKDNSNTNLIDPPKLKIITKKPILASKNEQKDNRRSKSAKLRIAEKIG
tara:strand:+ start:1310 stop:2206 length:897 start_codon:yes stop_codon:yes gene_type:complete